MCENKIHLLDAQNVCQENITSMQLCTFLWWYCKNVELGDAGVDDLWRWEDDVFTWVGEIAAAGSEVTLHLRTIFLRMEAPAAIYGTHTLCGVNCWWLWLAILVTLAYTEDRDLNLSPLTQSTTSQFLPVHPIFRLGFVVAGFKNPNHILITIKDKTFVFQFSSNSRPKIRKSWPTFNLKLWIDNCIRLMMIKQMVLFSSGCWKYLVHVDIMCWWNWVTSIRMLKILSEICWKYLVHVEIMC